MVKLRLRTKFLLSLLLVSCSVTCATLWMVSGSVRIRLRKEISENLRNSIVVFRDFQRQREIGLASSAELLANLPSLKALMTTRDAATIQDASADMWRLAPSDVFILADATGRVMAIHTRIPGITRTDAEGLLRIFLSSDQPCTKGAAERQKNLAQCVSARCSSTLLSKRRNPVARWLQPMGIVKHAAFDSKGRLTPRFLWAEANGLQVGSPGHAQGVEQQPLTQWATFSWPLRGIFVQSPSDQPSFWWYGAGHLYQVFLQPIYFGTPRSGSVLGILGVGHEISETLANEVSRIASSQVAFFYGDKLIASTVQPGQEPDLVRPAPAADFSASGPVEVHLAGERFLSTTVNLAPSILPFVRLSVLKSYDKAAIFLDSLNRRLLIVGLLAIVAGSGVVFLVSYTFTKPLANLVEGVRALESGNFAYPLTNRTGDEVAELTDAVDRMRTSLQRTQQELLASERLATIGRTASSISHDLRHPLTAVVANAEFLCGKNLADDQREELYREIRNAVDQMTDLVDSLLEFSLARESLRRVFGSVEETVERALHTVKMHPEFHRLNISVVREGRCETWFDHRKVERALVNLLMNACQSVSSDCGRIEVKLREDQNRVEIRVVDNGSGIAEAIREKLFEPFVSYGKQNGIGLGLAIGQKIFQDHGGDVCLESTEPGRTVFKTTLPILTA